MSRPGDVKIDKIEIKDFNKTRSFTLTEDLVRLKIHEDVFKNCMYGEIDFLDKMNALEELPILGEEYLTISFSLPWDSAKKRSFEFFIYAIEGYSYDTSQRYAIVTLKFISNEQMTNNLRLISTGFRDKKVSEYVKDIMTEVEYIGTKKNVNVQETTETKVIALPFLTPFEMIEFFRKNAYDAKSKTNSFVFFENHDGFNFTTIEELIKAGRDKPIQLYYIPTSDIKDEDDLMTKTRTVTDLSYVAVNDTIESMRKGVFNSKLMYFDFNTKVFNSEQFKVMDDFSGFEHLDKSPSLKNSDEFLRSIQQGESAGEKFIYNKSYFLPDDSSRLPENLDFVKMMGKKYSYVEQMLQTPLICNIYGDATIKAGDVVNILIPQPTAAEVGETGRKYQKYLNGNYFVARVNHTIEGGQYYKMQLQLYKESFGSPIVKDNPFYDSGVSTTIETVVGNGGF
jgi:hypothetical protein